MGFLPILVLAASLEDKDELCNVLDPARSWSKAWLPSLDSGTPGAPLPAPTLSLSNLTATRTLAQQTVSVPGWRYAFTSVSLTPSTSATSLALLLQLKILPGDEKGCGRLSRTARHPRPPRAAPSCSLQGVHSHHRQRTLYSAEEKSASSAQLSVKAVWKRGLNAPGVARAGCKICLCQSIPLLPYLGLTRRGGLRAGWRCRCVRTPGRGQGRSPSRLNHAHVDFPWLWPRNVLLEDFSLSKKFMREDENGVLLSEVSVSAVSSAVLVIHLGKDW